MKGQPEVRNTAVGYCSCSEGNRRTLLSNKALQPSCPGTCCAILSCENLVRVKVSTNRNIRKPHLSRTIQNQKANRYFPCPLLPAPSPPQNLRAAEMPQSLAMNISIPEPPTPHEGVCFHLMPDSRFLADFPSYCGLEAANLR